MDGAYRYSSGSTMQMLKDDSVRAGQADTVNDLELQGNGHDKVTPAPQAPPAPPPMTFPDGGREAWLVVLGGFLTMFCGFGIVNSFGVFQAYYKAHQLADRSESAIAWIGSLQLWGIFGVGLPAGILLDKYGARPPNFIGTVVFVFGIFMTSICKEYYQFFLAQGICCAIGLGLIFNPAITAPTQWFSTKRNLASALALSGSSVGGVVWPVMLNRMLNFNNVSFGWAVRAVAFIQLAVLLLASYLTKTRFPRNMSKGPPPFKMAFSDPRFFFWTLACLISFFGLYLPFFFLTPYGIFRGASTETAFYFSAILNAASFFGRWFTGFAADRVGTANSVIAACVASTVLAFCWSACETNAAIIVWTCLYGFTSGGVVAMLTPGIVRLVPQPRLTGVYVGMSCTVMAMGVLGGEPAGGRLITNSAQDPNVNPANIYNSMTFYGGGMLAGASVLFIIARILIGQKTWKA